MPPSLWFFNIIQCILKFFRNFADMILSSAFLALYEQQTFENVDRRTTRPTYTISLPII